MTSNSERIMEKSRNFQMVCAGRTYLLKQTFRNRGFPNRPTIPLGSSEFTSGCGTHGFSNILKPFITNEQVKLISFIWEGVDCDWEYLMYLLLLAPPPKNCLLNMISYQSINYTLNSCYYICIRFITTCFLICLKNITIRVTIEVQETLTNLSFQSI